MPVSFYTRDMNKNTAVTTLTTTHRRFPVDFSGWGAPDAAAQLLPIPAGLHGVITRVEHHGIAPFTRYSVEFEDGTRASGLALGRDIEVAR